MSEITIVLPFALPPAELAPDLLRALELPALGMLLARASATPMGAALPAFADNVGGGAADGFARALPHETWLARAFGIDTPETGSPAAAVALMSSHGPAPEEGYWFIVEPVHFHVARDHIVLTDPRSLALSETDAMDLFTAALPAFEAAGLTLRYGQGGRWFVRADAWRDLKTATPDATCGHNIDIWMPQGQSARAWRKLQNEVQMDWHAHAVNAARAADGLQPVNSLWLWGGADAASLPPKNPALTVAGFDGQFAAYAALAGAAVPVTDLIGTAGEAAPQRLLLRDDLIASALAGDWSSWLDGMRLLETTCFAPALAALRDGGVDSVRLLLGHATALHAWTARRAGLRRFWRAPSLSRLRSATDVGVAA